MPYPIPILLTIFNRPDVTMQVFEQIRSVQPQTLYIGSDGARPTKEGEQEKVLQLREMLLAAIDWQCDVHTLFRETNLGCRVAMSGAIDWFFSQEEMGVILEDDCLPNADFFLFMEEMLGRYAHEEKVMMVSSANFHGNQVWGNASYFFSAYPHCIGWGTWKRAWQHYDVNIHQDKHLSRSNERSMFAFQGESTFWNHQFSHVSNKTIDTWDYQWVYAIFHQSGLCITPNNNMIVNIGFGPGATHTDHEAPYFYKTAFEPLPIEIQHPSKIERNLQADEYEVRHVFKIKKGHRFGEAGRQFTRLRFKIAKTLRELRGQT